MGGNVEVKDYVLWTKHIHDAPELRLLLDRLPPEATVQLKVAGELGVWRKMSANTRTGGATPGLQPLGPAQKAWRNLFAISRQKGGDMVSVELADFALVIKEQKSAGEAPTSPDPVERRSAWEAIRDLWRTGGWRSEAPFGPRDELYER